MKQIDISSGKVSLKAELKDTPTAQAIWDTLPIDGTVNTWGDEIYFSIPVKMGQEPDATADVKIGDLGYWPAGHAFCIFFGPTPASTSEKPRAASAVNRIGRLTDDPSLLRLIQDGDPIRIDKNE